jgi:hypothetical protein
MEDHGFASDILRSSDFPVAKSHAKRRTRKVQPLYLAGGLLSLRTLRTH